MKPYNFKLPFDKNNKTAPYFIGLVNAQGKRGVIEGYTTRRRTEEFARR